MTLPKDWETAPVAGLRAHAIAVNDRRASVGYDRAITLCLSCGREGENQYGKDTNPAGRHRYCSVECMAFMHRYWELTGQLPKEAKDGLGLGGKQNQRGRVGAARTQEVAHGLGDHDEPESGHAGDTGDARPGDGQADTEGWVDVPSDTAGDTGVPDEEVP